MKTLQIRSHIGANGMLELKVPAGMTETDVEVIVVLQPLADESVNSDVAKERWQRFVRETAGSVQDPTFVRHEQGQFEQHA